MLEVEASLKLFGGLAKLLSALRGGVRALGLQATLGIAPTPLAARAFARAEARGIPVRSCTAMADLPARLADLPLFLLEWPGRTLELLADLGIVRVKDALALPRGGFSQRFGPEALAMLDRLAGRVPDPRLAYVPPARYRARLELPAEAEGVEAILFPLKRLLAEMEGYLRGRGAGVQELDLHPRARPQAPHAPRRFPSPRPSARRSSSSPSPAKSSAAWSSPRPPSGCASWPSACCPSRRGRAPGSPAARSAPWAAPASSSASRRGWGRGASSASRSPTTIAPSAAGRTRPPPRRAPPSTAARAPRGCSIARRSSWPAPRGPRCRATLELLAGPERIETGWWDGEPVSRDYFVAANPAGETCWIYRERRDPGAWYLHGVFA